MPWWRSRPGLQCSGSLAAREREREREVRRLVCHRQWRSLPRCRAAPSTMPRRLPTRRGTWAGSSRPTAPPGSTRPRRSSRRIYSSTSPDAIEVVVHPQSVVHRWPSSSMVPPRPSQPRRRCSSPSPSVWPGWTGWPTPRRGDLDPGRGSSFRSTPRPSPAAGWAGRSHRGPSWRFNAANEVLRHAFHDGAIRFTDIVDTVARVGPAYRGRWCG